MPADAVTAYGGVFDVEEFLCKYGLSEYAAKFVEEGFDSMEVLKIMTDADMTQCGVKRGHVLKIRLAVEGKALEIHPTEPGQMAIYRDSEAGDTEVFIARRDPAQKGHRIVQVLGSSEEQSVPMGKLFVAPPAAAQAAVRRDGQQASWPQAPASCMLGGVRVKNTFIEYQEEDDDAQPDYRRIVSMPPSFGTPGERTALGFVPMDAHAESLGAKLGIAEGGPAGTSFIHAKSLPSQASHLQVGSLKQPDCGGVQQSPANIISPPGLCGLGSPMKVSPHVPIQEPVATQPQGRLAVPQQQLPYQVIPNRVLPNDGLDLVSCHVDPRRALPKGSSAVTVKNTFVDVKDDDDDEQPSYKLAASSPPMARTSLAIEAIHPLASLGSAGHAEGNCRPCAHVWKPAGCDRGVNCCFCHLCTEDDFKSKRRAKLVYLKAEKSRQKQEADSADLDDQTRATDSGPKALTKAPGAPATSVVSISRSDANIDAVTQTVSPRSNGTVQRFVSGQELTAVQEGAGWNIQWVVDLHKLRTKSRCGDTKSFSLKLSDRQVNFRLFLKPSDQSATCAGTTARAGFRKDVQLASLRLKCMDTESLKPGARFSVAFAAGSFDWRWASRAHDFITEPDCGLQAQEAEWNLTVAAEGTEKCTLKAEVMPVE